MNITAAQEELMKRYKYLYENKDLILAMCINYGTEKEYYKKQIKASKELIKMYKKQGHGIDDIIDSTLLDVEIYRLYNNITNYKRKMHKVRPYLFAKVSDNILNAYEEFLLSDKNMEDTMLYNHIEAVKNNPQFLETFQDLIQKLEDRRNKNQHLRRVPTFTVWKILTYVRNKNHDNAFILEALDKYYNIERYMLTGIDFESGYNLFSYEAQEEYLKRYPQLLITTEATISNQYNAIISRYHRNEFELEDSYFEEVPDEWAISLNSYSKENYTNFTNALVNMPILSKELKSNLYQEINNPSKGNTKKLEI